MIHTPSLAAFARDAFAFVGTLTAAAVLGDYSAEARRLRADRANLLAHIAELTAERDNLAYRLAVAVGHPSARGHAADFDAWEREVMG